MGCGGSMSQAAADAYGSIMSGFYNQFSNLTGWLSETIENVKKGHENFMNSRMWEFSNRIGRTGTYVGRFEIGYLSDVEYQQQATGFMRNYIMANPETMQLYMDERISGYGGDFSPFCTGIGRENYYYNKAVDGMLRTENDQLVRTDYKTSRDEGTKLTVQERIDIHRTWNASSLHIAKNLFDFTSPGGGSILSIEQVEENRKKAQEEQE